MSAVEALKAARAAAMGISAPVGRPMKREEQSKNPPSGVTRELHAAKNQFAFQQKMNGG